MRSFQKRTKMLNKMTKTKKRVKIHPVMKRMKLLKKTKPPLVQAVKKRTRKRIEKRRRIAEIQITALRKNSQPAKLSLSLGTNGTTIVHNPENISVLNVDEEEDYTNAQNHKDIKPPLDTRLGRDDPFQFGTRYLNDETKIWDYNSWDHFEFGDEDIQNAQEKIKNQTFVPEEDRAKYYENPARYWDIFYKNNKENFFKDRKWLQIEFPTLYSATQKDSGAINICEIGCGAGNTFFPILRENENEKLRISAVDFSPRAVELVKTSPDFDSEYGHAAVWDLANEEGDLPEGLEPHSVDIAVMIFVFSALAPKQWSQAMDNLHKLLKPGGKILFRDYGRYDLAQVRFKKNRLLDENFYIRGDGTRVYFFTEEELRSIFTEKYFTENKIGTDRRLLINRKKQLKMYRQWVQAVFDVPA